MQTPKAAATAVGLCSLENEGSRSWLYCAA